MAGNSGNLLAALPASVDAEQIFAVVSNENLRIERIVSTGQASLPGFWYGPGGGGWGLGLAGSAGLLVEGEAATRVLRPGDYVHIPTHRRQDDTERPTVWLAVHYR